MPKFADIKPYTDDGRMENELNEKAREWVAALRSGKYKQGKGALSTEDRFCCLGVACEISKLTGE